MHFSRIVLFCLVALSGIALGDPPGVSYIFPAGGERGKTVAVRVGGHFLHDKAPWEMSGPGVKVSEEIVLTERIWFEGPLIKQPASQQKEDYPRDYLGSVQIDADTSLGYRHCRSWNAQGVTAALRFEIGDLPEVTEQEADGEPIPTLVELPVTVNGRIFPREDVDVWSFSAEAGQSITCSVAAVSLMAATIDPQLRFEPQLEIRDANDAVVAAETIALREDPQLRFTPTSSGRYSVRIWDSRASGLQHFVYRLTITPGPWIDSIYPLGGSAGSESEVTIAGNGYENQRMKIRWPDCEPGIVRHAFAGMNPLLIDVDCIPEVLEPAEGELPRLMCPGVANGRIEAPGDSDIWPFSAADTQPLRLEVRAARLGSPLDAVLIVRDEAGKELARGQNLPGGSTDCEINFTPPAAGNYTAEVRERFASRGGSNFAYRLRLTSQPADFQLTLASDSVAAVIGGEMKIPVAIARSGGFNGAVYLKMAGLPGGVSCAELYVPGNQNRGELVVKLHADLPAQLARVSVTGKGTLGENEVVRTATYAATLDSPPSNSLLLACTLATPFKLVGQYELRYVPRGGSLTKSFHIERNGFEGPITVSLADRQGRHLQGISGPTITVPADRSEFEYTVKLPPWMELGRTSRTNLMLVGELADASGKRHKVSFSNTEQNEQLIALVTAAPLRLSLATGVLAVQANTELVVPVQLHRQVGLSGTTQLELIVPGHMKDISAAAVEIEAHRETAELRLKLGPQPGPFNLPLTLRATTQHNGGPIVAEVPLELLLK